MLQRRNVFKVFFVVLLANFFIFSSTVQADILLNVPFFSQVDERWVDDYIIEGNDKKQIGDIGCMMTVFTMVLKYYGVNTNPREFNNWLKNHDGYDYDLLYWVPGVEDYAKEMGFNNIATGLKFADLIVGQNNKLIHNELIAGYPVIVKVPYANDHWMIVVEERNGQFYCWDPLDPPENTETVSINKYGAYSKYLTVHGPTHHPVIKFSDSSTVYLQSEVGKLWPILNEQTYILLGYRNEDCVSFVSDWGYVTELPENEKSNHSIMARAIPSQNDYQWNNLIAYKVVEKVGPVSCVSMAIDLSRIYLFGSDNKFHHITNEQVYYNLGYQDDWSEVVEISPDLFMQYGEGDAITEETISSVNPQPSFLGNFDPGPEMPDPIPIVYPPEDLTATVISPNQIDLSWDRGQNPSTNEYNGLRYRVYISVSQGSYSAVSEEIADNNYSITGLTSDVSYCLKISTYFIGDIDNHESDFSNIFCIRTPPETPPPEEECISPQNMTVSRSENNLTITWTDNSPQVIDYIIQVWENNGAMLNSLLATTTSLIYEETNLSPGKEYKVIGKTYCPNALSSDWSEPVFFLTDPSISPIQGFQVLE